MATTEQLEARLEALKKARDTGVLSIRHGETLTVYRDLNEINQIIRALESQIAAAGNTSIRSVRVHTESGW